MSAPLTLLESADLLGRYRYVELSLFSALGRRALSCEPQLAVYLSGASLAHSWRAGEVESRLPVSVGLPGVVALTRSPAPEIDEAVEVLVGEGAGSDVLDALLGAFYPAMESAYEERAAAASPVADAPVLRLLARLRADLAALRREGSLVSSRLGAPGPTRREEVDALLAVPGGAFGALRAARAVGARPRPV